MKKEKLNWYILIGFAALTVLFVILTIVKMIKNFNTVGVIALVIQIFAMGVVAYCLLQEKKEMKGVPTENVAQEETSDVDEEIAEVNEDIATEEESTEENDCQQAPEELNN